MQPVRIAPYGTWASPISAELVAAGSIRLSEVRVSGGQIWWLESRPGDGGRTVLCRRALGAPASSSSDVTPADVSVRNAVHEYGGGAYELVGETVFYSDFSDGRVWRLEPGSSPEPLMPEPSSPQALRYADMRALPDGKALVCIRETHSAEGVANEIVMLSASGEGEAEVVVAGSDFYAAARPSRDGRRVAWIQWNLPDMPWDGCELWVAGFDAATGISHPQQVAGSRTESVSQPEWADDGSLFFISDRTGWWNLYRWDAQGDGAGHPESPAVAAVTGLEAEVGVPQWVFGLSRYALLEDGSVVLAYGRGGFDRIGVLAAGSDRPAAPHQLDLPFCVYGHLAAAGPGTVACVAASVTEAPAVVVLDSGAGEVEVVRSNRAHVAAKGHASVPLAIEFQTEGGELAHAFYFAPFNGDFEAPQRTKPPLLVVSHGGPTAASVPAFRLEIQFWTSRGIAVADVNYRGSTGYGRHYRERLSGQWGIADVEDCIAAARYLVGEGLADPDRLAIRGGSAGGYTTLCALAFHDYFSAGASYYGVADAETLARDTHKFESRYLDKLIGPYPDDVETYRRRSPACFPDQLDCPVILFQGLEDAVVPPAQAEEMAATLDAKQIPHAYVAFEGEQHGFRRAENIERALEAELYFYGRVFGFDPAGEIEPVEICHAQKLSGSSRSQG